MLSGALKKYVHFKSQFRLFEEPFHSITLHTRTFALQYLFVRYIPILENKLSSNLRMRSVTD